MLLMVFLRMRGVYTGRFNVHEIPPTVNQSSSGSVLQRSAALSTPRGAETAGARAVRRV